MPSHVPLPVRSFIARWVLRFWHSRSRSLQFLAIFCTSSWICVHRAVLLCSHFRIFAKDYHRVKMNAPLPTFDMMTGQPTVSARPVSANAAAAAMLANDSDVVHVQLLDRMIVVPRAVVNVSVQAVFLYPSPNLQPRSPHERQLHTCLLLQGPILRNKITSPDGQAPIDQQGQAYLLFVDWKNFQPLLEYMCGNPVQLPRSVIWHCNVQV